MMRPVLAFGSMTILFLLAGCSCNTHYGFVDGNNHMIGYYDSYYAKRNKNELLEQKTMYEGRVVYTEINIDKVSFDGKELTNTGDYCESTYLIDAETFKVIDWKYLKGSNPSACREICGH